MLTRRNARTVIFSPSHKGVGAIATQRKVTDMLGIGGEYEGPDKSKRAVSIALGITSLVGVLGAVRTVWVEPKNTKALVAWGAVGAGALFANTLIY